MESVTQRDSGSVQTCTHHRLYLTHHYCFTINYSHMFGPISAVNIIVRVSLVFEIV